MPFFKLLSTPQIILYYPFRSQVLWPFIKLNRLASPTIAKDILHRWLLLIIGLMLLLVCSVWLMRYRNRPLTGFLANKRYSMEFLLILMVRVQMVISLILVLELQLPLMRPIDPLSNILLVPFLSQRQLLNLILRSVVLIWCVWKILSLLCNGFLTLLQMFFLHIFNLVILLLQVLVVLQVVMVLLQQIMLYSSIVVYFLELIMKSGTSALEFHIIRTMTKRLTRSWSR